MNLENIALASLGAIVIDHSSSSDDHHYPPNNVLSPKEEVQLPAYRKYGIALKDCLSLSLSVLSMFQSSTLISQESAFTAGTTTPPIQK